MVAAAGSMAAGTGAAAAPLPPVRLSADGRFATVAPGTSAVPVGLLAMIFATEPPRSQFLPVTQDDFLALAQRRQVAGVSLQFAWADIQPLPPPAPLNFSVVTRALDMMSTACELAGRPPNCLPVFLKPYLSCEPAWASPFPPGNPTPVVRTNPLGMRVVVRPTAPDGTDLWNKYIDSQQVEPRRAVPVSTDPAWQAQMRRLTAAVGAWLGRVDPNATRVPFVHFLGPVMGSLQMRPGPSGLFAFLGNSGVDTLGMNWTKDGHMAAWSAAAGGFASASPEFAKRPWAFDFTVLPPSSRNASALFLDTADQVSVFDALAAEHPRGPGAVLAKTESLHVDLAKPGGVDSTCAFKPDPEHSRGSFAVQYLERDNQPKIPYAYIGARTGRHGWENFAPLAMKSLPFNHSSVPSMYPIPTLAKFSVWADMNATAPRVPQGTLWAETWRNEAVNASLQPACVAPRELAADLARWDSDIRSALRPALAEGGTVEARDGGSGVAAERLSTGASLEVASSGSTAAGAGLDRTAPPDGGAVFGVWTQKVPGIAGSLPYVRGAQAVVQWRDVQPARDTYNFSALDASAASALAGVPAGRRPLLTVQVNGNRHPDWMFDLLPACTNDTASWAKENQDPRGVLQFWHPFFVSQYAGLIRTFAAHVAAAPYHDAVAGVRMSWDAAGTESAGVPPEHRDPAQWPRPPNGLPAAAPFNASTALGYQRSVFRAHVAAFASPRRPQDRTFLLVRNNLPDELRSEPVTLPDGATGPATRLFDSGAAGWFHTSSEIEPRTVGAGGKGSDAGQYNTFTTWCKASPPSTLCYAEPWASAFGDHGGDSPDARWCPAPQWEYWRVLSDLHCGVTYVALYGSDMEVAASGLYPTANGEDVGSSFRCAYNASFSFAAAYAGAMLLAPSAAPGAWIAFRVSRSQIPGYDNVTDYFQRMTLDESATIGFDALDARFDGARVPVVANRTTPGLFAIGPYWQRYGAWARRLRGGAGHAVLRVDHAFASSLGERCGGGGGGHSGGGGGGGGGNCSVVSATLRVVYLAAAPSAPLPAPAAAGNAACSVSVYVGAVALPGFNLQTGGRWQQHTWQLSAAGVSALAASPTVELRSSCDVVLHMVELVRGDGATSAAGREVCDGP